MSSSANPELERLTIALDQMVAALDANLERTTELRRRLSALRGRVDSGASARELLIGEDPPRSVELLTANVDALHTAGATFRAALARALYDDGLTIAAIAEEFGVTRQRISALLKQHHATVEL